MSYKAGQRGAIMDAVLQAMPGTAQDIERATGLRADQVQRAVQRTCRSGHAESRKRVTGRGMFGGGHMTTEYRRTAAGDAAVEG